MPATPQGKPPRPVSMRRGPRRALVVGLVLWALAAAKIDVGHTGVVLDDGLYLASARAIERGEGYRLPSRPGSPPPKYPVGLPAAIALGLRLAPGPSTLGRDVAIGRALVIASGLAFFAAAYGWLVRVRVSDGAAVLIVLATAFHHVALIGCGSTVFSDLPFAAFVYVLLARTAGRLVSTPVRSAVDGLLAGVGYLLRGNGITLIAAALVAAWRGPRRWGPLASCLLGVALAAGPLLLAFPKGPRAIPSGDYAIEMREGWSSPAAGLRIVGGNLRSIALTFPARVAVPNADYTDAIVRWLAETPTARRVLEAAISLVVLVGLTRLARSRRGTDAPAWVHAAGTLVIFAGWPWNSILDRFLLSLFPMVLLALAAGVSGLAQGLGLGPVGRRRAALTVLGLALLGSLSVTGRGIGRFFSDGRQWPGATSRASLDQALAAIALRTEPDAVVATAWPELVWLHTGRQAVPLTEDDDMMLRRYGRVERLKLWLPAIGRRPAYLLVRLELEDARGIDLSQVKGLEADPLLDLEPIFRASDGRYAVFRLVRNGP